MNSFISRKNANDKYVVCLQFTALTLNRIHDNIQLGVSVACRAGVVSFPTVENDRCQLNCNSFVLATVNFMLPRELS